MEFGAAAYMLAAVVGVAVGGASSWGMWAVGNAASARSVNRSPEFRSWLIRAVYLAGALWIILAALASKWLTLAIVHGVWKKTPF
jgi:hypothetical protein